MAYYIQKPFTSNSNELSVYYQQVARSDGNGVMDTIWTDKYDDKTSISAEPVAQSIASTFKNAQVRKSNANGR